MVPLAVLLTSPLRLLLRAVLERLPLLVAQLTSPRKSPLLVVLPVALATSPLRPLLPAELQRLPPPAALLTNRKKSPQPAVLPVALATSNRFFSLKTVPGRKILAGNLAYYSVLPIYDRNKEFAR